MFGIYGASGHAKVITEILENSGNRIRAVYDDDPDKTLLLTHNVSHDKNIFIQSNLNWLIAIGNNQTRKKIAESFQINFGTAIDISAHVSKTAVLGKGIVVMPGCCINSSTIIGKHCILNTCSSIDHDCILGDYVHISPNVTLCGSVKVGEGTQLGASTVAIPGINIGKWATIGAGSVIINDIPDFATVVGNPGRIIKIRR